jgi:hypothetical protein
MFARPFNFLFRQKFQAEHRCTKSAARHAGNRGRQRRDTFLHAIMKHFGPLGRFHGSFSFFRSSAIEDGAHCGGVMDVAFEVDRGSRPRPMRARVLFALLASLSIGLTMLPTRDASAGGILDAIIGMLSGRPPAVVRGPLGYGSPFSDQDGATTLPRHDGRIGRGTPYCVRLCDGRYFPLSRAIGSSLTDTCNALCPASRTRIFWGSQSGPGVSEDGTAYDALPNAYVYREQLPPDCTCNGKTGGGLATIDATRDPTLQPGDIVVAGDGMRVFAATTQNGRRTLSFTPAKDYTPLPRDIRRKLATMRIGPIE